MPELPEVETVVSLLKTLVVHEVIESVEIYWNNIIGEPNVTTFRNNIEHQVITDVTRRGKYIIFALSNGHLVSHLRMEGKYYVYDEKVEKDKHTHVIFSFKSGKEMHYHDTRKFGKMYLYPKNEPLAILSKLGYEPWDQDLSADALLDLAKRRSISIKAFLLDQSVIAGIGNIYVNEILFTTKIHPAQPVNTLSKKQFDAIIKATASILSAAIESGGTTIRSYTSSLGVTGLFQQQLNVHNRQNEACNVCGSDIEKIVVAQRGTYLCPICQSIQ